MATRKKKKSAGDPTANKSGAIDERASRLDEGRRGRGRKAGDGKGVDIGISPGAFVGLERHLKSLSPAAKSKLHGHITKHVGEAMKPLSKLVKAKGTKHEQDLLADVGPNMMRTIIEFLESNTA
jgi:hypothetical protein